jgi:hypothetical protein
MIGANESHPQEQYYQRKTMMASDMKWQQQPILN